MENHTEAVLSHFLKESLKGKTALITGGTTGIGRATTFLLASSGMKVMFFGRHEQELKDTLNDLREAKLEDNVYGLVADTSKTEDIQRVFTKVDQEFGQLDILINNAAVGYGSILEGTYKEWQEVVQINLLGYMAFTHEAAVRMKAQGKGHIVHIGSMSADEREEGSSIYVATKAGVQGFSEALRKEVNPLGIKVSLIEPGAVGTDMQGQFSPGEQREREEKMKMLKAEDIAACILYILSQPERCDIVDIKIRPHLQLI